MSEWRRRAISDFPEFRTEMERAQSPHAVFIHLLPALQDAYNAKPWDESMIGRIYAYGSWMLAPERPKNIRGAALASFYEHLTDLGPAWKDLPHRATEGEMAIVREHLRGYLKPAEYEQAMLALDRTVADARSVPRAV